MLEQGKMDFAIPGAVTEVDKPELPPNPDGGGGMDGNVDGWGPEDNVELPVI